MTKNALGLPFVWHRIAATMKTTHSDGSIVTCADDHRFIISDGGRVKARFMLNE
jgi:hypothetical protein